MPWLYGEKVRLRASERTDLPTFVRWFADPEFTENLGNQKVMGLADEEAWFESMIKGPIDTHVLVIEARIPPNDPNSDMVWQPIGTIAFHDINQNSRSAEIGIGIGEKAYWSQGYGSDAIRVLLKHGFYTLNFHRIYLRVHASNARGTRAYERVGFIHEGTMREAHFVNGEYQDVHLMSILRPEWANISSKKGKCNGKY